MQRGHPEAQDVLPDQVLVSVLEMIPRHAVFSSAALVNKRWLRVSTSKDLWAAKMSAALSHCCTGLEADAAASWGKLYFRVYQTNLLANPYLNPALLLAGLAMAPGSWVVTLQGGNGWKWEPQPDMGQLSSLPHVQAGAAAVPTPCLPYGKMDASSGEVAGAVASSYRWCELVQVVDLQQELVRRGLSEEAAAGFLDSSPPLSFSVWYAGRADCPGECEAKILLTAAPIYVPAGCAPTGGPPAAAHPAHSAARLWSWSTGCVQPGSASWQRAHCVAAGYPAGVRCAVVVLRGRDMRFWKGHYGAKLAAPSLRFLAPDELEAPGAPEA